MNRVVSHLDAQFVLSLESDVPLQGVVGKQSITLLFEGHNLVPGKGSLGPVRTVLPPATISHLARRSAFNICVLSLCLKAPCAVWQPRSLSTEASGIANLPNEVSAVAKTTEVCIMLDSNWLGRRNHNRLQSAAEGFRQLASIPLELSSALAQSHRQALWSFYRLVDRAVASIEEGVQASDPPTYARLSSKRPRQARTSLTPDSPLPKRLLAEDAPEDLTRSVSPTELATQSSQDILEDGHTGDLTQSVLPVELDAESLHEEDIPQDGSRKDLTKSFSPTDLATQSSPGKVIPETSSITSPERCYSPTELATQTSQGARSTTSQGARSTTSSAATVVVDIFQDSISKGIEKLLPELLPDILPKLLPTILKDILPGLLRTALPNLLAARPSSPSQSPSPSPESSTSADPPKLNALLSGYVKAYLQRIFDRAVDAAAESASRLAEIELAETLDDHRTDILAIRQEAEMDMERIANEQVEAFRDMLEDVSEDVGSEVEKHAGEAVGRACDLLDEVMSARWVGDALSQHLEESQASLASQVSGPV